MPYLRAKYAPLKFRYGDTCLHEMHAPEYAHWVKMAFPLGMGGADFNIKFDKKNGALIGLSFVSRSGAFHSIDKWKDEFARGITKLEDLDALFGGLIAFHSETMYRGQIRLMSKAAWPALTDVPVRTNIASFLTPPIDPLRNGKGNKCKKNAVPLPNQTMPSVNDKDEEAYLQLCARRGDALILKPAFWQPDLSANQLTSTFTISKGASNFVIDWTIELVGRGDINREISIKVKKCCPGNTVCECASHFEEAEKMVRHFHDVRQELGIFRAIADVVEML